MDELHFEDYKNIGNPSDIPYLKSCSFLDYYKYLLEDNFSELEQHLLSNFSNIGLKSIPTLSKDQIIEGLLTVSKRDYQRKLKDKNYYKCNIVCFIKTLKTVFTQDLYDAISQESTPELIIHNYAHIMIHMLSDLDYLIGLYKYVFFKTPPTLVRKGQMHYYELHQVLRQAIYGQNSYHAFCDLEMSASIPVIRNLVEIRIRRAFGVLSYLDKQDNLVPLSMGKLFEVLRKNRSSICTPVKLENIERIYKWSNVTVHSGSVEHSWIPMFIENVLRELSMGKAPDDKGFDVKSGIQTDSVTIQSIVNELEGTIPSKCIFSRKGTPRKLYRCKPECLIVDAKK